MRIPWEPNVPMLRLIRISDDEQTANSTQSVHNKVRIYLNFRSERIKVIINQHSYNITRNVMNEADYAN